MPALANVKMATLHRCYPQLARRRALFYERAMISPANC
jgi:hypothetical protein